VSERPYKGAYSHERAVEIIKENRGSHFDPKIVDVFLEVEALFAGVRKC
jgi:putative two-component system response regulator